ncbi:MAG TPA: hypothetical protein VJH95_01535 [Candidatus Nanoarchaeia archaeon]|nr:hypothetical protein [Candidatus Nanoarchaeia archaeon]
MNTTIQVSQATRQKLELLKDKEELNSFNEVISRVVDKELKITDSFFGKLKVTPWRKADRMRIHGE